MITNRDGIIEYVNSALKSLTGYTCDEAIGRSSCANRGLRADCLSARLHAGELAPAQARRNDWPLSCSPLPR